MATGISYSKLRDGSWGIAGPANLIVVGRSVTVRKKSGETKDERVKAIVWSGDGKAIASVESSRPPTASSAPSGGRSTGGKRRKRGARYCEGWGADNPHPPKAPYECMECGYDE